jgi:hypothetical protein
MQDSLHCDCAGTCCELCFARNCARCMPQERYVSGLDHILDMDNASYHDFEWGAKCLSGCGTIWFTYQGYQLEVI